MLDATVERLTATLSVKTHGGDSPLPAVIPARYRAGEMVLSFFPTIAHFGSAEDIALAELKIEMMFPADEQTRTILLSMAGQMGGSHSPKLNDAPKPN